MSRDHPRSRGVYQCPQMAVSLLTGSSPLARGLQPEQHHPASRVGIIPARAGFTSNMSEEMCKLEDHPRSRGVYMNRRSPTGMAAGSSPLARGLLARSRSAGRGGRIIPARAGFTARSR